MLLILSVFMLATVSRGQSLNPLIKDNKGLSKFFVSMKTDQQVAFNAAERNKLIGLEAPADLRLVQSFTDKLGYKHYKYQQTWKGLPVEGAIFSFHVRDNKIYAVNGQIILDTKQMPTQSEKPAIDVSTAIQQAMTASKATKFAWQDEEMEAKIKKEKGNTTASYKPQAKLVWYCNGESLDPAMLRLAYKINVYSVQPLANADYYIDAQTGTFISKDDKIHFTDAVGTAQTAYSGVQTIHSDFTGGVYHLRDYTKGNGVITLHGETGQKGNDYVSNSSNWSFSNEDKAALDAHFGVSASWQFYNDVFGRNSYDGNGAAIYSYVNVPNFVDDAYWDGTAINFCKRSNGALGGVTAIDVAGHELTHGVTEHTSGLKYRRESGGINESLSDIMGKVIQFYTKPNDINWVISNDMNWAIRNMANPKEFKQPDTYKGTYWVERSDPHLLSGVGNYMFYLLTDGGSGTNDRGMNYNVNGIGIEKARAIVYRSNLLYLTPTSTYYNWRLACEQAAMDLYGNNNEYTQVMNAWDAVGVDSLSSIYCFGPISFEDSLVYPFKALVHWEQYEHRAESFQLKWRELGTGIPWNIVTGITDSSYLIRNLKPYTFYEMKVASVCPGNIVSEIQPYWTFETQTLGGYCVPDMVGSNMSSFINSVSLNGITNTSGQGNDGNIPSYQNFIKTIFPLNKNNSYTIEVQPGFNWPPQEVTMSVYIDYNKNRQLDDPGELVGRVKSPNGATVSIPFTVPNTARNGLSRLRVILEESFFAYDKPCLQANGETEDYSIFISPTSSANFSSSHPALEGGSQDLRIMPNPVNNTAVLSYTLVSGGQVELQITDYLGRKIRQINLGNQVKGNHQATISTEQMISGNYQVQVWKDGGIMGNIKMVVIK